MKIGFIINSVLAASFFTILLLTANTMSQAVRERTNELGVLKSIGYPDALIMIFVLMESILICLIGAAIGVLLAFFLSILMLPILFYYFPSPKIITKTKESIWYRLLPGFFEWVVAHKKTVWISSFVFILAAGFGMTMLTSDNLIMDDIKDSAPVKKDFGRP